MTKDWKKLMNYFRMELKTYKGQKLIDSINKYNQNLSPECQSDEYFMNPPASYIDEATGITYNTAEEQPGYFVAIPKRLI